MNEMTEKQKLWAQTKGEGLSENATEWLVEVVTIGNLRASLWIFDNDQGLTGYAIKIKHVEVLSREGRILEREDIWSLHRSVEWGFREMLERHNNALRETSDDFLVMGELPAISRPGNKS
jgi:hypothetical protein